MSVTSGTSPTRAELEAAAALVRERVPPTPTIAWPLLRERLGLELFVKHENHTPLGAFKMRGGLVLMDRLTRDRPDVRGVVSATRGNHGQSLAFAAARYGIGAVIVVPHGNSVEKNDAMRALGAELVEHGADFQAAAEHARELARVRQLTFVPSFDPRLVLGVATYGLELFTAVEGLDVVYVPIGMGSGICGTIAARDALEVRCEIVGVVAEGAPAYARSFAERRVVTTERADTFADGVSCRVPDPVALATILAGAARVITVSDDEIAASMRMLFSATHNAAEPAGAVALAGAARERARLRGRRVAVVLSGANVDSAVFARVLAASGAPAEPST